MSEPESTQLGQAAKAVAEIFGCSYEEAVKVLVIGINARREEQERERVERARARGELRVGGGAAG